MPEIKCPKCSEFYSASELNCPHCRETMDLPAEVESHDPSDQGGASGGRLTQKCPFCAEEILVDAVKCKHCKEFLNKDQSLSESCSDCGAPLKAGSSFCPSCKVMQIDVEPAESSSYISHRKCLQCNYKGQMKTWLANYALPKLIIILGLFFLLIPGVIFWAWGWGKYKCPSCGALAKSVPQ